MKKLALVLLLAAFTAAVYAALVAGPVTPWRVQSDITFNTDGTPRSAIVQTYYRRVYTDGATSIPEDLGSVQWDAVANASKTVTYNGNTYTYGEALAVVIAIANQERASQLAAKAASPNP